MNVSDANLLVMAFIGFAVYFGIEKLITKRFGNVDSSEIKENAKEAIEKYRSEYEKNNKVRELLAVVKDSDQEIIEKGKLVLERSYSVDYEDDGLINLWCGELSSISSALRSVVMTRELAELLIEVAIYNIVMKMLEMERRIAIVNSLLNRVSVDFDFEDAVDYEIEKDDYWHRIQEAKLERARLIDRIKNYLALS